MRILYEMNNLSKLAASSGVNNSKITRLEVNAMAGVKVIDLADLLKANTDDKMIHAIPPN